MLMQKQAHFYAANVDMCLKNVKIKKKKRNNFYLT